MKARPSPLAKPSRLGAVVVALFALALPAAAQRIDSTRVTPRAPTVDTSTTVAPAPPLSPRKAFLYALLMPGYSQSKLGRPTATAIFSTTEAIGIAMLIQSRIELAEARRLRTDSLVTIGYDASGVPITYASYYNDGLISIRRSHVEDWVAFIVANHLFAAADAYVSAHLWDLPTQVSVKATTTGAVVAARFTW